MLTSNHLAPWGTNAGQHVAGRVTAGNRSASRVVVPFIISGTTHPQDGGKKYRTLRAKSERSTQGSLLVRKKAHQISDAPEKSQRSALEKKTKKFPDFTWKFEAEQARRLAEKQKAAVWLTVRDLRKVDEDPIVVQVAREYPNLQGWTTRVSVEELVQRARNQEAMDLVESWLLEDVALESDSWDVLEAELNRDRLSERKLWHSGS